MRNRLLEAFFIRATVTEASTVGRFRRLRLRAPQLSTVDWTPGQQIRVDCGPADALTPLLRTYSVWDRQDDWIDLYCLVHGTGPGSAWAATAEPGDQVLHSKPKGDFVTRTAAFHLFVGEETASAAFGPMIRALPDHVPVHALVETADAADRLPITRDVSWLSRPSGTAPQDPAALVAAVTGLSLPDQPGTAYLAGEARTIQAVRTVLTRDLGWPRRAIHTKPFWTPGKRGLE